MSLSMAGRWKIDFRDGTTETIYGQVSSEDGMLRITHYPHGHPETDIRWPLDLIERVSRA